MANEEGEISVENMDEDEEMEQSSLTHGSAPTSVIVSVTGEGQADSDPEHSSSATPSPSHSPQFQIPDINTQRMLRNRLQVRQTLSEPGLKAKLHRQKQRMSPILRRHDLSKTLSVGASLDASGGGSGQGIWKPMDVASYAGPHSPTAASMEHEGGGEDTPIVSTATHTLLQGAAFPAGRIPLLGMPTGSWLTAQGLIPSQEQLEAMQKQQLEAFQKQQLELLSRMQAAGGATGPGPEVFQYPLALWTIAGQGAPGQIQVPITTTSSSATPSPTPSNSSTDSGIASSDSFQLAASQRRPLSESQSAPGVAEVQYEAAVKQYQLQHQQLLSQQQQLYQQYLEQQHKLMQQALLERRHFEDQQRKLAAMHVRQQAQLQKQQQQLLRHMQEQQLLQLQRQQQLLLLQSMQQAAQQQAAVQAAQLAQAHAVKQQNPLRRISGKLDTVSLPYPSKPVLTAKGSNSSTGLPEGAEMRSLSVEQRSPSLTPKASLTPTNSLDSTNGRTSPHVGVASPSSGQQEPPSAQQGGGTGLVFDTMMLKHSCNCGGSHPEHPGRLQSIWARLHETRVVLSCQRLRARKASLAELQSVHSENHVKLYGRPTQRKPGQERKDLGRAFVQLPCGGTGVDQDTYWNDAHTSNAARMAVGSVIELADKVISGEVKNGFAIVRPPGHHALPNQAKAFCYFNNVAVAAKSMVSKNKRVLVVDWDIHHGNGIQQVFYDNPAVLFISIHRYDNGTFFPGTGRPEEIGSGAGLSYNVNIAFSGGQNLQGFTASNYGDAEYLAAFRSVVLPISREYKPDIILVSAGFNATDGHPPTLGGYSVTPKCYAHLTRMLMHSGNGKVVLALEGGYELMSLCGSAEACMRGLLGHELPPLDSTAVDRAPHPAAIASLEQTLACHKPYWSCLSRSAPLLHMTHSEAERRDVEEADTVSALASLSMATDLQTRPISMGTTV